MKSMCPVKCDDRGSAVIYYAGFLCAAGGAYRHASSVEEALKRKGWRVALYCFDSLPLYVRYLPHFFYWLLNKVNPPFGFIVKGKLAALLFYWFRKPRPEELVIYEDIYSAWATKNRSLVILHAVWSDNLEGMSYKRKTVKTLISEEARILSSLYMPIVTVSEEYRDYLITSHFNGYKLPTIDVARLGVDMDRISLFKKNPEARRRNSIVFSGACIERKNIPLLFEALRVLRRSGEEWRLTIIGDGPLLPQLKLLAAEWSLPIYFSGRLTGDDVYRELGMHSVYVHTSTKESFSFSLLEAKVVGLKTCAYIGLEVPSVFIDEKVGSFIAEDWAEAIRSCQEKDYRKVDLSEYSASAMIDRLIRIAGIG